MSIRFSNNAKTVLAASILASDELITVEDTSSFPTLTGDDYFFGVLSDDLGNLEIVKVTAEPVSGTYSVIRGMEGTTPYAFSTEDSFELRVTAGTLESSVGLAETSAITSLGTVMATTDGASGIGPAYLDSAVDDYSATITSDTTYEGARAYYYGENFWTNALYSPDVCVGGTATADFSAYPTTRAPEYAFDDDPATYWVSGVGGSGGTYRWIAYEFTTAVTPARMVITAVSGGVGCISGEQYIEYWDEITSAWITVQEYTESYMPSSGGSLTFDIDTENRVSAIKWRLRFLNDSYSNSTTIATFEVFEVWAVGDSVLDLQVTGESQTLQSGTDTVYAMVEYMPEELSGTITLNTDLTLEVSIDGGTTWKTATLVPAGNIRREYGSR